MNTALGRIRRPESGSGDQGLTSKATSDRFPGVTLSDFLSCWGPAFPPWGRVLLTLISGAHASPCGKASVAPLQISLNLRSGDGLPGIAPDFSFQGLIKKFQLKYRIEGVIKAGGWGDVCGTSEGVVG